MQIQYKALLVLFFLVNFSFSFVYAQRTVSKAGKLEIRADRLFDDFSYFKARDVYKKVVLLDNTNDRAKLRVAECYLKLNKPDLAEEWYNKLSKDFISNSSDDLLRFGESLLKNKKYVPAKQIYEAVSIISPDNVRATNLLKGIQNIDKFFIDSLKFDIRQVPFNSDAADFSPAYYDKGLVFVSGRSTSSPVKYVYNWDHTNFLDLYYVERQGNDGFGQPVRFSPKMNTRYHEGPLAFFDNGRQVIFTRNNFYRGASELSEEGINRLQLFHSVLNTNNDTWSTPKRIEIITKDYSAGHPSVSQDGKKMFFASNIPGGHGMVDIYYSESIDGKWGNPVNLGNSINTNGNELFPFLANESTLYFASDGQPGLGGLDIFKAEFKPDGTVSVRNMGFPLNTNLDDFGLIVSGDRGYFSSNRFEVDNIFEIYFSYIPVEVVLLDSITMEVLAGEISVLNNTQNLGVELLDYNGAKLFDAPRNVEFEVSGKATGYSAKNIIFTNTNLVYSPEPHRIEVLMSKPQIQKPDGSYLTGTIYSETTRKPIPGHIKLIPKFNGSEVYTDTLGNYALKLPETGKFTVEALAHGYFADSDTLMIASLSTNRTYKKDFYLKEALIGSKIRLNRVFFDFDKATLRPESMEELDKLVDFMEESPELTVEISGHTDNKGSSAYNKTLSGRRAKSVMEYLIKNGVNPKRMTSVGYGMEQPEVPNDSDENRQLNRRVEFKITGTNFDYRF